MGNAAPGGQEQEPAQGRETRISVSASTTSDRMPTIQKTSPPKLPMPPEEELEERFNVVLVSGYTCRAAKTEIGLGLF